MAQSRPSITKRRKELARLEKRRIKTERKAARDAARDENHPDTPAGVDPDIAHIVPGPQPEPWTEEGLPDGV